MANHFIETMLPTLPAGDLSGLVPEVLTEYLEALDALALIPGPLGEAAKARADSLRPTLRREATRPRPAVDPRGLHESPR